MSRQGQLQPPLTTPIPISCRHRQVPACTCRPVLIVKTASSSVVTVSGHEITDWRRTRSHGCKSLKHSPRISEDYAGIFCHALLIFSYSSFVLVRVHRHCGYSWHWKMPKLRWLTISVSSIFQWQTTISQSARADKIHHFFECHFCPTVPNYFRSVNFRSPKESGLWCTNEREKLVRRHTFVGPHVDWRSTYTQYNTVHQPSRPRVRARARAHTHTHAHTHTRTHTHSHTHTRTHTLTHTHTQCHTYKSTLPAHIHILSSLFLCFCIYACLPVSLSLSLSLSVAVSVSLSPPPVISVSSNCPTFYDIIISNQSPHGAVTIIFQCEFKTSLSPRPPQSSA